MSEGSQASVLDALTNDAICAWIATFPSEGRLTSFLDSLPEEQRDPVRQRAKLLFDFADSALHQAAQLGPVDLPVFHANLQEQLSRRHPWMSEEAFARLQAYTGWYCWREGY